MKLKSSISYLLFIFLATTAFGSFANAHSGKFKVLHTKKIHSAHRTRSVYFYVPPYKRGGEYTLSIQNGKKLRLRNCSNIKGFLSYFRRRACYSYNAKEKFEFAQSRIRYGEIRLNGEVIVDSDALNRDTDKLSLPVQVGKHNMLKLTLDGPRYSRIYLTINGDKNLRPLSLFTTANYRHKHFLLDGEAEVSFNAAHSKDLDGNIAEYKWDFGDGESATTTTPQVSHIYESIGTYKVKLTVIDNEGGSRTSKRYIYVTEPEDLDARFNVFPEILGNVVVNGTRVYAKDLTYTEIGNYITSREWTLKDSQGNIINSGSGRLVYHTFHVSAPEIFTVELKVTDKFGRVSTSTQDVVVVMHH